MFYTDYTYDKKVDKYYLNPYKERIMDIIRDFWEYRFEDVMKAFWNRSNFIIFCSMIIFLVAIPWSILYRCSQRFHPSLKDKSMLAQAVRMRRPLKLFIWLNIFAVLFVLKTIVFILKVCFLIMILPRSLAFVKINPFRHGGDYR